MAKVVDPKTVEPSSGTIYPKSLAGAVAGRSRRRLTGPAGLTQFGVNIATLEPGSATSHRHWHEREDEFVYVLDGEVILVSDEGEQQLGPGMAVGFPAGEANGHQFVNRSARPVTLMEVGTRALADRVTYSDVDMAASKTDGSWVVTRKDGRPFE
jgi:uncharacterized cupin superfamily protein